MDQTAPEDKILLWQIREHGEDPNMDRHISLRAGCHNEKAVQARAKSLYNFTELEHHPFREKAYFASLNSAGLHK